MRRITAPESGPAQARKRPGGTGDGRPHVRGAVRRLPECGAFRYLRATWLLQRVRSRNTGTPIGVRRLADSGEGGTAGEFGTPGALRVRACRAAGRELPGTDCEAGTPVPPCAPPPAASSRAARLRPGGAEKSSSGPVPTGHGGGRRGRVSGEAVRETVAVLRAELFTGSRMSGNFRCRCADQEDRDTSGQPPGSQPSAVPGRISLKDLGSGRAVRSCTGRKSTSPYGEVAGKWWSS